MRWSLAFISLTLLCSAAQPRISKIWEIHNLLAGASLVACAAPTATRLTGHKNTVAGHLADEIETTFKVFVLVKRDGATKTFVLRYFRYSNGYTPVLAEASFVTFDLSAHRNYLMFLRREPDGRYSPITGQEDASSAIADVGPAQCGV